MCILSAHACTFQGGGGAYPIHLAGPPIKHWCVGCGEGRVDGVSCANVAASFTRTKLCKAPGLRYQVHVYFWTSKTTKRVPPSPKGYSPSRGRRLIILHATFLVFPPRDTQMLLNLH